MQNCKYDTVIVSVHSFSVFFLVCTQTQRDKIMKDSLESKRWRINNKRNVNARKKVLLKEENHMLRMCAAAYSRKMESHEKIFINNSGIIQLFWHSFGGLFFHVSGSAYTAPVPPFRWCNIAKETHSSDGIDHKNISQFHSLWIMSHLQRFSCEKTWKFKEGVRGKGEPKLTLNMPCLETE